MKCADQVVDGWGEIQNGRRFLLQHRRHHFSTYWGELADLDVTHAKVLQPEPTVVDAWLSDLIEEQRIPEYITLNTDLDAAGAAVAFDGSRSAAP